MSAGKKMKKLSILFEVLVVIAWGTFIGMASSKFDPGNTVFEAAGAISGLSFGLLIAWGVRFLTASLKSIKS